MLREWLQGFSLRAKRDFTGISQECMSAIVKAGSVSGPYRATDSFRDFARDFLSKYSDGDFRAKFGMPSMTINDLQFLSRAAGWTE